MTLDSVVSKINTSKVFVSSSLLRQILRESAGAGAGEGNEHQSARSGDGDNEGFGYKTFLGHLYDLLEDKTTTERYEEGVRQLVGNQVSKASWWKCWPGTVICRADEDKQRQSSFSIRL